MNQNKFVPLKRKLFFSIGISVLIFGAIATTVNYLQTKESFINISKNEQIELTKHNADITHDLFLLGKNVSENISLMPEVKKFLDQNIKTEAEQEGLRLHLSHFNIRNLFSSIYIINTSGVAVVSTDQSFEGNNYGFRKYYLSAMKGLTSVDMVVGVTSKKPGFYFSTPIKNFEGNIIGAGVVKLDTAPILEKYEQGTNAGYINYMLVAEDAMVLLSNKTDRIFKNLNALSLSMVQIEELKKHYGLTNIQSLTYDEVLKEINKKTQLTIFEIYDVLEKEKEVIALSRIGDYPYYFITEDYSERILILARHPLIVSISFNLFGMLMATLLSYLLITRFMRPFPNLQKMAEKISKGQFDTKMEFSSNDETFLLGKTMLEMAEKLRNLYGNLNEEVQKKTTELNEKMKDLEKINKFMVGRELKMIELKKQVAELKSALDKYQNIK